MCRRIHMAWECWKAAGEYKQTPVNYHWLQGSTSCKCLRTTKLNGFHSFRDQTSLS